MTVNNNGADPAVLRAAPLAVHTPTGPSTGPAQARKR